MSDSVFENPMFVAMVKGQTRAQFKFERPVQLSYDTFIAIFREAARLYASTNMTMEDCLEDALNVQEQKFDDTVRHGYKSACGLEFYRRKKAGIDFQAELTLKRPFLPTEVYEQDM